MNKKSSWLYISILLLLIAVIWAAISAYSQFKKPTVSADLQKIMEPLDPNLDMVTLQKIKSRAP